MFRYVRVGAMVLASCWTAAAMAQSVEEAEKQITAKLKEVRSITADMKMTMKIEQPYQMSMQMNGKMAAMYHDDKYYVKQDTNTETNIKMGEQEQSMKGTTSTVVDGEFEYTVVDQMGMKQAIKRKISEVPSIGAGYFEQLKKQYDLKRVETKDVDGAKHWVVYGEMKEAPPPGGPAPKEFAFFFRESDGVMSRMQATNDAGEPFMTMQLDNIKVNEKLDRAQFKFVAPEGVTVMDMTNE